MAPATASTAAPSATLLSPAELSYLYTSLSLSPPIRPDARKPTQFRSLTAELDILPSTHGSSRLIWPDGGECIVGIKAEVEKTPVPPLSSENTLSIAKVDQRSWIEASVEVSGARDDDPLVVLLVNSVADLLGQKLAGRLEIGDRWHWKLYIDVRRPYSTYQ